MGREKLRYSDPVYYKCALQDLLQEARENGLDISLGDNGARMTVYFRADNDECAGATLIDRSI